MDIYQTDSLDLIFVKLAKLHFQSAHALFSRENVYPGQPPLLRILSKRNAQTQKELAEQMQIAPATLTVMINRMEKAGLVKRRVDEQDHRVSRVYLTEKGEEAHKKVREAIKVIEETCYSNFTSEEKVIFRRLMLQMYENLLKADFKQE